MRVFESVLDQAGRVSREAGSVRREAKYLPLHEIRLPQAGLEVAQGHGLASPPSPIATNFHPEVGLRSTFLR